MRGKITDQDLTDYALNELPPSERLYVESMLGVSEECRGDVYQMLDLGEMLKEGFEADERKDEVGAELLLNEAQRAQVLDVPRWNLMHFFRQAAAVALLAAGTAYLVSHQGAFGRGGSGSDMSGQNFASNPQELTERGMKAGLANTSPEAPDPEDMQFVMTGPAVCTPPTLSDMPAMPEVVGM